VTDTGLSPRPTSGCFQFNCGAIIVLIRVVGIRGMGDKAQESWANFLDPDILRRNLIVASIYIAAFELLKNTIVDRIRDFFTTGFDQSGLRIDPKYQSEVLVRNSSRVYASLDWLKESQAIDGNDVANFERVKKCRNEIAHEIPRILMEGLPDEFPARFSEMVCILDKIERWWIVNVEISTAPQLVGEEIDEENIIPGPIIGLRLMLDIALGSDEDSRRYMDEFVKRTQPPKKSVQ
jgi:hypothetical protein